MRKTVLTLLVLFLFTPANSFASNDSTKEFYQAEKAFSAGNYAEAENNYRLAFNRYHTMGNLAAYIQSRIAECCKYQNKTMDAVDAYRKIQLEFPSSPDAGEAQEKIARTYYEAGDYARAGQPAAFYAVAEIPHLAQFLQRLPLVRQRIHHLNRHPKQIIIIPLTSH